MFHSARLKLTAWYLVIIMSVSLLFSAIIYRVLITEVSRFDRIQRYRIENRFNLPPDSFHLPANTELFAEISHRILFMLGIINLGVLVVSGGLGYLLAGETLKPIKDMVEEQNRFVSDASHELKTPLTSLKSAFEVYLRNKKRDLNEADTLVSESIAEVNKLQLLTESLLHLDHHQKANTKIIFERLSLAKVLNLAVKKISPLANKKRIIIDKKYLDYQITGAQDRLIDLFVILLDNAVKYSQNRSKITLSAQKTKGGVKIAVTDQGIGIAKKDQPFIFNRLYRADTSRTKNRENGFGIGLSIAQKIVTLHSGKIAVISKVGQGSTFTVTLPQTKKS